MEAHKYFVDLAWNSDRVSSPDLYHRIEVATPPEFPKGMPGIWSPKHLVTAAVNSCFMTTFLAVAENSKLEFTSLTCSAEGVLDKKEGKFAMTEVVLKPVLTIPNEADRERAEKIMMKAERACLISNSVTSEVHLEPKVVVEEPQTA